MHDCFRDDRHGCPTVADCLHLLTVDPSTQTEGQSCEQIDLALLWICLLFDWGVWGCLGGNLWSGEILFSLGTTKLDVTFGGRTISHSALVLPTKAFQAVLGLDFLCTTPCQGLLTSPEPCMITKNTPFEKCITSKKRTKCTRSPTNCGRPSRTHSTPKATALETMEVDPREFQIDLFAKLKNFTRPLFCRRENCAFRYD